MDTSADPSDDDAAAASVDPGTLAARLLPTARAAAATAVELIYDNRPDHLTVQHKSSATDHVTDMDRASEAEIRAVITEDRPGDVIVGEEQGGTVEPGRVTWWVDPIDGTTNYVYDHPGYAVSIAAWFDDTPLVGVVADPTHGRTYWATADGGAHCDGTPLRIGAPPPLEQMLVATGFGYDPARRAIQGRVVAELLPHIRDIRRMGAAAVDLCSVAAGRVDAYYETGLSQWDMAAGWLIATEAGAALESIEGGPARPGSVLVCHPSRLQELRRLLLTCGARGV